MITIEVEIPNELRRLREEWLDQCGEDENELEWNLTGIDLHRELLIYDPKNVLYRYTLARLLVDHAADIKERYSKFREAKELLKQAICLEPRSKLNKYYLGVITATEKRWENALRFFDFDIDTSLLGQVEKVRAYCIIAICNKMLGNIIQAEQALKRAKELNENTTNVDIQYFDAIIFGLDPLEPKDANSFNERITIGRPDSDFAQLLVMTREGSKIVSNQDINHLYLSEEECLLLDLRPQFSYADSRPIRRHSCSFKLSPSEETIQLQPKEAELLATLLLSPRPVSAQVIKENLWKDSKNTNVVKSYINKLRNKLKVLYNEDISEVIVQELGCYIWRDNRPFKIISFQGLYKSLLR